MSSVMSIALNRSSVFNAPVARPFSNFNPSVRVEFCLAYKAMESYWFAKSTTSKQMKRVVATALNESSDSPVEKFRDDASPNILPDVWGDLFLAYEAMEPFPEEEENELKRLREDIIMMLKTTPDGSSLKLDLIDNIQRLGLSYQFEDEIEGCLSNLYNSHHRESQNDLHVVALCFRFLNSKVTMFLLVHMLKKFTNQEGEFDQKSLANDVRGLLSLYEASQYGVPGEHILDEAMRFSTRNLEHIAKNVGGLVANKINHAITWPIRKTLDRVMAREYIRLYQKDASHNEVLMRFAKLDFNRVQRIHQQELCALSKWWKGLDCAKNYPFVRPRVVENYFALAGMCFEPQYSLGRKVVNIFTNIFSIVDDICDECATVDDLRLLTYATERWNVDAVNELPPYIRPCFQFLFKSYSELEEELGKHGIAGQLEYAKAEAKEYVKRACKEAYRYHSGYIPTFEEYMDDGVVTIGVYFVATMSYIGKGDLISKAVLDWAISWPLPIRASGRITRLIDDLSDHSEMGRATAVECFMNQYGLSRKEAVEEVEKQLSKEWKDLNRECLLQTAMPLKIVEQGLNYARMMFSLYRYGDGYLVHDSESSRLVKSVFVDPIN